MHILEHLFLVGEFPERARLLSGLTLEQVKLCPEGASHSIYEELWHVVGYQQSILERADPTGEFLRVLGLFEGQARTLTHLGVWMSRDRRTALALVQTAAPGFDLDAQQANLAAIERAFSAARAAAGVEGAVLRLSGPALFAVRSRDTIRRDVQRLSAADATGEMAGSSSEVVDDRIRCSSAALG